MKFGLRKPSLKKSFKARTTGKWKRALKRAVIPGYGRRGMGILHPKRAMYNRIYRRTTFSVFDVFRVLFGSSRQRKTKAVRVAPVVPTTDWAAIQNDVAGAVDCLRPEQRSLFQERYEAAAIDLNRTMVYWLLTGLVGGHRFYFHDTLQAVLMALFFCYVVLWCGQWWGCLWWIGDLFFMVQRVQRANLLTKKRLITDIENAEMQQVLHAGADAACEEGRSDPAVPDLSGEAAGEVRQRSFRIEDFYPPDTEKFFMNDDEKAFFQAFFLHFSALGLPFEIGVNRMSDGTLNFCYDCMQIGRVRLQKRKHFMQILQGDKGEVIAGELPLFVERLPDWMAYIQRLQGRSGREDQNGLSQNI